MIEGPKLGRDGGASLAKDGTVKSRSGYLTWGGGGNPTEVKSNQRTKRSNPRGGRHPFSVKRKELYGSGGPANFISR